MEKPLHHIQNTVKPLRSHVKFGDSPLFFTAHSIHTNGGFLYFCAQFKEHPQSAAAYHTGHAYRTRIEDAHRERAPTESKILKTNV